LADGRSPFLEHVHPFCSKQDKEQIRRFLSRQVKGITRNMSFCFPPQWAISRRARNRLTHARNGNTYSQFAASSSKGRGKTKAKGQQTQADAILSPEIQEEMFRNAIKDAMPEAAKRRLEPRVVPAEWKSPVLHHSEMTSAGGICSAPKQCIPDLLRQIGYTQAPTYCHVVHATPARIGTTWLSCAGADMDLSSERR
jgi:hypothetical protein